ncbi:hypothetical protein ACOMHN_063555 [Nucella lapillus]
MFVTSTREPDRWADIFPPLTPTEEDGTDRDGVSVSAHSSMMEAANAEEHWEVMAMATGPPETAGTCADLDCEGTMPGGSG